MSETLKLADNLLQIAVATVSRGATSPGRAVLHSPNATAHVRDRSEAEGA